MGEHAQLGVLERTRIKPMTLESLRGRLVTNELQAREAYVESLTRAQRVLQRQSGIVWLWQNVPVYALQDVHTDREMIVRFLQRKVPVVGGSLPLFDALRQGKASAVLLGDVGHSQDEIQWKKQDGKITSVAGIELAATLNAEQMCFDLVSEFPGRFLWLRGNHDSQRKTHFGDNNGKNVAIAQAMKNQLGGDVYAGWIQTEDLLPFMAANPYIFLSHAAPGAHVDVNEVRAKKDSAYKLLTSTENRIEVEGSMSEKEMEENMKTIHKQLRFDPDPQWVWIIGHRQTDKVEGGFRMQCNDRLIQINQKHGELYAVIHPDGSVFIGDCRNEDQPVLVKRDLNSRCHP